MTEQTTHTAAIADALAAPIEDNTEALEAREALDVLREKMIDAMTPGVEVEFDPDEAELAGAFVEDALSEQDAAESIDDLAELGDGEEPVPTTTNP